MQLNIATDYAVRIVLYMSRQKGVITSKELSDNLNISQAFIFKIMRKLNNAKILNVLTGTYGGYILVKEAKEINLFEIMNAMEKTLKLHRCLEKGQEYGDFEWESRILLNIYADMQECFEDKLKAITIQEILDAN